MLFGAHVSIAGGLANAPKNAAGLGCEIFQIFTRSPQGGYIAPLDKKIAAEFKNLCQEYGQKEWAVHAPYFINFASASTRIANASANVIREELGRASLLGARYLMTHLGSYKDLGHNVSLKQLTVGLNRVLAGYKGETEFLIEIAAGAGEIIGDTFEEIAEIINQPILKKYNIGVCYDTQHGFASGYDIRAPAAVADTWKKFDKIIGLGKLKLSHCNDSKTDFGSRRDRHEHIGAGKIGRTGFESLLAHPAMQKINFILETEPDGVKKDLKLLKKIREQLI